MASRILQGWGRQPRVAALERLAEDLEQASAGATLARGMGRSYGDASLPPAGTVAVSSLLADRLLGFEPATGRLHAEAGLKLAEINRLFLPRLFASPTLPGTQLITLGGMVAADVHGKEHHVAGTFGRHVERLRIRLGSGDVVWCDREQRADLFRATLGGMGLTGHVLEVVCRLQRIPSPWIVQETLRIPSLDAFLAALKESAAKWPMTMGWIDCLKRGPRMGRGILFRGRWAESGEAPARLPRAKRKLRVPFDFPEFALNPVTIGVFNSLFYAANFPKIGVVDPDSFFHPLDKILDWNRGYGKRGFTQYQCVIPEHHGAAGVRRFLDALTAERAASFLCVIKDCGVEGEGLLSFPLRGTSIAVDLAIGRDTAALVGRLNQLLIELGGRVYLAKDTFTTAGDFAKMEPRLAAFREVRRRYDPDGRLRSFQSIRLFGDPA
jgi:decaprenylphospho-beta-D-ribofuranose 2-oxidase